MIFRLLIDIFKECLGPFVAPKPKNIPTGDAYSRSIKSLLSDNSEEDKDNCDKNGKIKNRKIKNRKEKNIKEDKENKEKERSGNINKMDLDGDIEKLFNKRREALLRKDKKTGCISSLQADEYNKNTDNAKKKLSAKERRRDRANESCNKKSKLDKGPNVECKTEKNKKRARSALEKELNAELMKIYNKDSKLDQSKNKMCVSTNKLKAKRDELYENIPKCYDSRKKSSETNKNETKNSETNKNSTSAFETLDHNTPFIKNRVSRSMTHQIKFKKFKESEENLSKLIESYSEDNLDGVNVDFNRKLAVKMHSYLRKRDKN